MSVLDILGNLKTPQCYSYDQVGKFINRLTSIPLRTDNITGIPYVNIPCAFDIESSSFRTGDKKDIKHCTMYLWQYCHGGINIFGRTWEQYCELLQKIHDKYRLDPMGRRLLIYVHNLAFDFGYLYPHINVIDMFATKNREPLKVLTDLGIEYRCSARLSGCKLDLLPKEISLINIRKLKENINYRDIRTSYSTVPQKIIDYGINDVRIVSAYIYQKMLENDNDITKIVLTKTGEVRRFMRQKCLGGKNSRKYKSLIKQLTMSDQEYKQLKKLFTGGFVHTYLFHSGETHYNIDSYDICSDYPTRLVVEKYPMSKGTFYEHPDDGFVKYCLANKCCHFKATFTEFVAKGFVAFVSESKILDEDKEEVCAENGRILYAKKMSIIICEVDYQAYQLIYTWESVKITNMYVYDKELLPTEFVEGVLILYQQKTTLKKESYATVEEASKYTLFKGMLNSCYGLCVFDPVTDEVHFENGWIDDILTMTPDQIAEKEEKRIHDKIVEYNNDRNRFLFYPWGCWCTAYARYEIAKLIYMTTDMKHLNYQNSTQYKMSDIKITEKQNDYVYSDTDSIKIKNASKYEYYIECYNQWITNKIKRVLEYHNLPFELSAPENEAHIRKPMGILEHDAHYDRFKALRCKSYLYETKGKISATVSGIDDNHLVSYLKDKVTEYNRNHRKQIDIFDIFTDGIEVPANRTGKLTHTYIEEPMEGVIKDCNGNLSEYHEKAGVHLEPAPFSLSLSKEYAEILEQFLCSTSSEEYWEL